jgi:hypothetical protein
MVMRDEAGMNLLAEPIAPTWQDRVRMEKSELDERIGKLCDFLRTEAYRALPHTDQHLLDRQLCHMRDYAHVLFMRVARFG